MSESGDARSERGVGRDRQVVRLVKLDWLSDQGNDEEHQKVPCSFCGEEHMGELYESPPDGFYVRYYCAKKAKRGRRSFP